MSKNHIYHIADDQPMSLIIGSKVYNKAYICYLDDDLIKLLDRHSQGLDFVLVHHRAASIYSTVIVVYMPINSLKIFEIKAPQFCDNKITDN